MVLYNEWTLQNTTSNNDKSWNGVTYGFDQSGNGLYVAVSTTGVMTSSNGTDWINRSSPSGSWRAVTYGFDQSGNGLFVAVAYNSNRVMTSYNGTDWAWQTSKINDWVSITYGNGLFVAIAYNSVVSVDSINSDNRVMTSPDGVNWTLRTTESNSNVWQSVTFGFDQSGNGLFVAVSSSNTSDGVNKVMTSLDGTTWKLRTAANNNKWTGVTYGFDQSGNGLFVAVSQSGNNTGVMTSPNGTTWKLQTSPTNLWYGVTYGNGQFVAVAYTGVGDRVMTSSNGTTWKSENSAADNVWVSVTYGNGQFAAVSQTGNNYKVMTKNILKQTPTITNFNIPTKIYGDSPFQITQPTSNSNGAFSYASYNTSVATISGNTITIVGVGISTITATQAATTNYTSGFTDASFTVTKATPNITNFYIPTKTYGDPSFVIIDPSSNSNGAFSYTSSNTSVATISGNTITIIGGGISTITATQAATPNYTSGFTDASFTVTLAEPLITNFNIPTKIYGDSPFQITQPTSNSDGAFSYASSNTSVATISGNTITIVGGGISTITATQAATTNYTSGTIPTTFTVTLATPNITNFYIPTKTYGDPSFVIIDPSSNSNGAFSYASSNTSVATISGNTITIVGGGISTITATQAATTNYTSGTMPTTFTVTQSTPTIGPLSIPSQMSMGQSYTIANPSSNSNGSFNYTSSNPLVETISSGNILTAVGVGSTTITATQAATLDYTSGSVEAISNACFPAGTLISCNQGFIPIELINPDIHTIRGKKIVTITKTIIQNKYLICFEKGSLGNNIPNRQTIMSKNHQLFYNGKMIKAQQFASKFKNVKKITYIGEVLYNVLMEKHDKMVVHNLICETLNPEHDIAKLHTIVKDMSSENKIKFIQKYNKTYIEKNKNKKMNIK